MLRRSFAILCLVLSSSCFAQDHFRFVVTGDGRSGNGRVGKDLNGVNVADMTVLVKAMIAEKPAVLVFSGDTVAGAETDDEEMIQYKTWFDVMKPAYDAGIHVLVVRGNHEMHAPHADELWRKVFSGPYANPNNGPDPEKDSTFSFTYGNSVFIGLDQFQSKEPTINQGWLDGVLAIAKQQHIFVFAHKMGFRAGHHNDGMEKVPEARDAFFESLAKAGCHTFFCGHDHLYDHTTVSRDGWPATKGIEQYVVGTAGAPFAKGNDHDGNVGSWKLTQRSHIEDHLGYALVEVNGSNVTVAFKGETSPGVFDVMDTYSYTEPAK